METLLRMLGAPSLLASAGGEVTLRVDRLVRGADTLDAQLAMMWSNASLPSQSRDLRIALGDVRAELSGQGREVPGTIQNTGGDVAFAARSAPPPTARRASTSRSSHAPASLATVPTRSRRPSA